MVNLPIVKKLKRQAHREMASLQDIIVSELYNHFNDAVIHGGTAIWRCYGGSRFSEDVDVYLPLKARKSGAMKEFVKKLESRGLGVLKFKETSNSIFSKFSVGNVIVRFEAVFADRKNHIIAQYETSDGNLVSVRTFSPEELIKEKVDAYISRRKIRDIYDIFFLLGKVNDKNAVQNSLSKLLGNYKSPLDEDDLKILIITGIVPKTLDIIEAIKRWAK